MVVTTRRKPRTPKPPEPPAARPAHRPARDGVAADAWIKVRVTPARKAGWTAVADRMGISLSELVKSLVDREAKRLGISVDEITP